MLFLKVRAALTIGVFLVGGFVPGKVSAEEPSAVNKQKLTSLDEIVVTATKIEEPKGDVPASLQVISGEDLKGSPAKSVGGLATEASLGHITRYGETLIGEVQIRGLSTDLFSPLSSRVLVLINGNNAGTVNLAKIPVDDIERIEIVKGPASVLYGSSAMGGVINVITKKGKEGFHGSAGVGMGSWEYWKTSAELSGKTGRFDYFVTAGRQGQGDYDAAGSGKIKNTAYQTEALSTRLGTSFFENHQLSLGYQHWKGWEMGSPGPTYSPDPDNYVNRQRDHFDANYTTETFRVKYYLVKDRDESHGGMTTGVGNSNIYTTNTDTQGLSLQKTFSIDDHRVIIGGQWDRIQVGSTSNTGAPYNPDSKYDSYGAFSEGRLSLFQKRLLVSAGLRVDAFQNEILATPGIASLIPKKQDMEHLTTRGGMVWKVTNDLSLKGTIGTAFRAPAPLEVAADYLSYGTHYLGNPNLKPEQSTTYDLGIDYSKGTFKGDMTFFNTDFKDKIVSRYDTTRKVSTYGNTDGATLQGLEMRASYDLGSALGFNLFIAPFMNVTYMIKRLDEGGTVSTTLLNTPKWTGAFGLKIGQDKWETRLIANYTGNEEVRDWNLASPTYGQTIVKGDFIVFHLKGAYRPLKCLELSLSLENLLDLAYEYKLGYPMAHRTIIGGIKWLF